MDKNRKRSKGQPNRSSDMGQMDSSRESTRERGSGSSGERSSSNTGGISNRDLGSEISEQQQVPERGRAKSERDTTERDQ